MDSTSSPTRYLVFTCLQQPPKCCRRPTMTCPYGKLQSGDRWLLSVGRTMHERGIKRSEGASFPLAVSDWREEYLALCALPGLRVKRLLTSIDLIPGRGWFSWISPGITYDTIPPTYGIWRGDSCQSSLAGISH